MPALPILLAVVGYWVAYAGVKKLSLLDAYRCAAQPTKAAVSDPGGDISISVPGGPTLKVTTDCTPKPGDTRLPGGFIWRPIGAGVLGQVNGQLVGPC